MKYEIEIEGLPEGWRAVAYRKPKKSEKYFDVEEKRILTAAFDCGSARLIIEKIPPRRIVLEDTGEIRQPSAGDYVFNNGNFCLCRKPDRWGNEHEIWRVVEVGE